MSIAHDLIAALPQWGPGLIAVSAFVSCMMIPVPTSVLLVTAGALSGTGHLYLPVLIVAASLGAFAGDLAAYLLARRAMPFLSRPGSRQARILSRAHGFLDRRGTMAVFLSRWLISPLGPPMNYAAGAAGLPLSRFAWASLSGEVIWATLHLLAGHLFGHSVRHSDGAFVKAVVIGVLLGAAMIGARIWWRRRHGRG